MPIDKSLFNQGIELLSKEYGSSKYYAHKVKLIWNTVQHEDGHVFLKACESIISNHRFNPTIADIANSVRIELMKKGSRNTDFHKFESIKGCALYSCESTSGLLTVYDHNGDTYTFKCSCKKGQSRTEQWPTFYLSKLWQKYVLSKDDIDLLIAYRSVKYPKDEKVTYVPPEGMYRNTKHNNYYEAIGESNE